MKVLALVILGLGLSLGSIAQAKSCVEGSKAPFREKVSPGDDNTETVWRTCVNGSYYPKAGPVTIKRCKEGSTYRFRESDGPGDDAKWVWRTCENGRFYPKAAPVTIKVCREGHSQVFIEHEGDDSYRVIKTCINGKYR